MSRWHNTLYRVAKNGKIRVWSCRVVREHVLTESSWLGGKVQHTDSVGKAKNIGRSNETMAEQDAIEIAKRKIRAKIEQGYEEELRQDASSKITFPLRRSLRMWKPQQELSPSLRKLALKGDAWATLKKDGVRLVIAIDPEGEVEVYSSTMSNKHHSDPPDARLKDRFLNLVQEIKERKLPPSTILLGEAVADPYDRARKEVAEFMASSTVEALKKPPLLFYVWDIPLFHGSPIGMTESIGYRYGLIWRIFGHTWKEDSWFLPIESVKTSNLCSIAKVSGAGTGLDPIESAKAVATLTEEEGWVIVDPKATFGSMAWNYRGSPERPEGVGKLKPELERDCVMLWDPDRGIGKWGTGNNRGTVGSVALYVNGPEGLTYLCDCGSGIDSKFRQTYTTPSSFPLVGEIQYDQQLPSGALQHPRLIRVRQDKKPEDCF